MGEESKMNEKVNVFERILLEQTKFPRLGETKLVVRIFSQTLEDLLYHGENRRKKDSQEDAKRFLRSNSFEFYANLIGLKPSWIRSLIKNGLVKV